MQLFIFLLQTVMSTLMGVLILKWYVWPWLKRVDLVTGFTPLLLFHALRYIGLISLVPVVVDPALTKTNFAEQQGWGDLVVALLALLALVALRMRKPIALSLLWIFNIVGTLDLFNSIYLANVDKIDEYNLFSFWFIPTVWVPALLLTHGVIFVMLKNRSAELKKILSN